MNGAVEERESSSLKEAKYFYDGLSMMFENNNCGYLPAFFSKKMNQKGILFTKDDFQDLVDDFVIQANLSILPDNFCIFIKYSPIVLFKYWIFTLSNVETIKISQRSSAFERDYFFLIIDDFPHFFSMTTNIAHERFLVNLYQQDEIPIKAVTFSAFLQQGKKLVVYKDYRERKVSVVSLKKALEVNRLHSVRIVFLKTSEKIKFSVQIDGGEKIVHMVWLKNSQKEIGKEGLKKDVAEVLKKYRDEAFSIISRTDGQVKELNKHANLSLGRVNKIPILINLPKGKADMSIHLSFDEEKEILTIWDEFNKKIKSFKITSAPKSNWLEVV